MSKKTNKTGVKKARKPAEKVPLTYEKQYQKYQSLIENNLTKHLKKSEGKYGDILYEAQAYSLKAGGKRIRPILMLAVCDMLGGDIYKALPFACALEYIHTYSLIHDDLPAMDNDDFRRGKPTNHKEFGEATAILAGDALLTTAADIMNEAMFTAIENGIEDPTNEMGVMEIYSFAMASKAILTAAGSTGMILGQVMDICQEKYADLPDDKKADYIIETYYCKTGQLILAAVGAGLLIGAADTENRKLTQEEFHQVEPDLRFFGETLGVSFQIRDDILDEIGDSKTLGKETGSDEKNKKITFVSHFGLDKAMEEFELMTEGIFEALDNIKEKIDTSFLEELVRRLSVRTN
jgi:geranylgeranyl diphosphate synthase type II